MRQQEGSGVQQNPTQRWLALAKGEVKINVDGAMARNFRGGAVTAACRDHMGMYLGSSAMLYRGVIDPTMLET